ncbi:MAG: Holliday junction branch migration protein RuvA [Bdellovibrionaceae bacterium]|nr:Holliday junction branch migration protein RuvA [Pseudobdellovibrionaceae bacterium]
MIGYLQGRPLRFAQDHMILLVQGVGYEVHCSSQSLQDLEGKTFVEVWVHTHVREDALTLFGFSTEIERSLFQSLTKVNGVGPKSALNILSGAPTNQILQWIEDSNTGALSKLPKIGKKTAEQIVLTLQGKLVRTGVSESSQRFVARPQIISALVNLGFRLGDVEKVVDQMPAETDLEGGLRRALSALTS